MKKSPHPVKPTEARLKGVIVAAFGRHYEVNTAAGRLQCYPRGKKSSYACGDEVEIVRGGDGQGVIEKLTPRRNLLWRSDAFREKLTWHGLTPESNPSAGNRFRGLYNIALKSLGAVQKAGHAVLTQALGYGERVREPGLALLEAPGNDAAIGGLKVVTENGWFAARPSGTESIYKIYMESFKGEAHLDLIQQEAQQIVSAALAKAGV